MARSLRPHLPGAPFHLTARLQGRKPWFVDLQRTVAHWIRVEAARSGCDLLAFAVMPNHLHLIVAQGARPLGELMQPLLRRLALLVHVRHATEGHVFQRRYHSAPCTDPDYLRNAIAYVHLNPVRAGLCQNPEDYVWTTHSEYRSFAGRGRAPRSGIGGGLELFSPYIGATVKEMRDSYLAFLRWRVFADSCSRASPHRRRILCPPPPSTSGGDGYWAERFGWSCTPLAERQLPRPPLLDLRDFALRFLRGIDPAMQLDRLRSGDRSRALVAVRREFIVCAKENGHRNRSIARFLNISDVTVSRT